MSNLAERLRAMHKDLEKDAQCGNWTAIDGRYDELLKAADELEKKTMNTNDLDLFVDILEYSTHDELRKLKKHASNKATDLSIRASSRAVWRDYLALINKQINKF